jgi:zinc protease
VVFAATGPQNWKAALGQLLEELSSVVEKEVSPQELEAAKEFLTGSYVFDLETNQGLAQALLTLELFELGRDYYLRYPERIRSIGGDEVRRVAGKYLDTVNYTSIAVGAV